MVLAILTLSVILRIPEIPNVVEAPGVLRVLGVLVTGKGYHFYTMPPERTLY